jgi:hypothetical protein
MQVEHVDKPEPSTWQAGRACGGGESGQWVGRTEAGVVHVDHDTAGRRPDAQGHWRAAMPPSVGYGFGHAKDQLLEPGIRDMAAAGRGDGVPGLGSGWFDQVDRGRGLLNRIRQRRQSLDH